MMSRKEKKILKEILKNKLTVDSKPMTIRRLSSITNETIDELYQIINLLLTRKYVNKYNGYQGAWTVQPVIITKDGLDALEFPWLKILQNTSIVTAVIISIIALFS